MALGRAAARVLGPGHRFVVGRDTRVSGPLLAGGAGGRARRRGRGRRRSSGSCPRRAWRACRLQTACPRPMISASHNPFPDNGIKFFAAGGRKLTDEVEEQLEPSSTGCSSAVSPTSRRRAGCRRGHTRCSAIVERYEAAVIAIARGPASRRPAGRDRLRQRRRLRGRAPGARAARAPSVEVLNAEPDGTQHQRRVRLDPPRGPPAARSSRAGADVGLAFDGDADRVLAVDDDGRAGRRRPPHRDLCALDLRDRDCSATTRSSSR